MREIINTLEAWHERGDALAMATVVRAYGETSPGPGFDTVAPDLEDVYFCTIAQHLKTSDGDVAGRQALRAPAGAESAA